MYKRFTQEACNVLLLAEDEARRLGQTRIGTEQLLLGLIGERHGVATKSFDAPPINESEPPTESTAQVVSQGCQQVVSESVSQPDAVSAPIKAPQPAQKLAPATPTRQPQVFQVDNSEALLLFRSHPLLRVKRGDGCHLSWQRVVSVEHLC